MYYSQFAQDKFVNDNYVKNARNGFFVDVGAHNGVLYSNSYFFESELDWNGICVEPMVSEFEKLSQVRKSININGCAYSKDGTVLFSEVEDRKSPQAEHSFNMLSGIVGHHSTKQRVQKYGLQTEYVEMPCWQLQTLFGEHQVEVVDYLSIDTEGSELEVLKGVDFSKVKINLIGLEHNEIPELMQAAEALLSEKNFRLVTNIAADAFYINEDVMWSWAR